MDEFNQEHDALLDSALNELTIVPLPPDFTNQIMANVHAANAQPAQRYAVPAASIRYRLQFLDIALALFWSLVLVFIWMIALWWTGLIRLDWLPQVQHSFSFVEQLSLTNSSFLLVGIIVLLLEMCLLGLVAVNLFGERPTAL